jgi:transposase, IS30 family
MKLKQGAFMNYTQLTEVKRYQIYTLLKNDFTQIAIADQINVHPSTISREVARNTGDRGYRPKQANEKALERRHTAEKHHRMDLKLQETIIGYLKQDWSPEQITGFLKSAGEIWVSHETIYQFILEDKAGGGQLYKHLRHSGKKRKKRYGSTDRRGQIKDRVSIDQRPKSIEKRERIGDWEIDLVIGKNHKQAVVTIVDRLSLMTLIAKVEGKHAELVTEATINQLKHYKTHAAFSMTADNGKEFSGHKEISKALGLDFYFAHPYSSWERGTNENTNGLIRQYLPKRCAFDGVNEKKCQFIMDRLNNRPRKCLGYRTPRQVFEEFLEAA